MKHDLVAWEKCAPNDAQFVRAPNSARIVPYLGMFQRVCLDKLIADVQHHVKEEETDLFPKIKQNTTAEQRAKMGPIISALKKEAPSQPNPNQPPPAPSAAATGQMNSFWETLSK